MADVQRLGDLARRGFDRHHLAFTLEFARHLHAKIDIEQVVRRTATIDEDIVAVGSEPFVPTKERPHQIECGTHRGSDTANRNVAASDGGNSPGRHGSSNDLIVHLHSQRAPPCS